MLEIEFIFVLVLISLVTLIIVGVHIGLVLGVVSLFGTFLLFGDLGITFELANQAAYGVLRNSLFAAIPLFVLMGEILSKTGMATDLYAVINHYSRRLPGRLAVATVFGNSIFAAVTGVSIASAMAFSRIAYPQMRAHGYEKKFALGSIAGSACLGMLIPPSVLMIVWGVVTEESIGKLFLAGVIPGLILALLMSGYCVVRAALSDKVAPANRSSEDNVAPSTRQVLSGLGIIALIFLVMGGLFAGFFAPSESAAVGCAGALVFAVARRSKRQIYSEAIIDSGKTIAPILFLLLAASMYAKFLALGGIIAMIQEFIGGLGLTGWSVTLLIVVIWLLLGTLIDSISIILLTVPIFWPLAQDIGWDAYAFAIFGILAIEAGLLTPPFGLLVYTVKASVPDDSVNLNQIFVGSIPYWLLMLAVMAIIYIWPSTATLLTR